MRAVHSRLHKGFTLVELVIVIIILSALGIMTSSYIGTGVDIYTDITERDKSLSSVRFVMERLRREVANALPNSASISDSSDVLNGCLTFRPIVASTLYASDFPIEPISRVSGAIATIPVDDYTFENGDQAVIYLLSADEIINTGKVKTLVDDTTNSSLVFSDADGFVLASPAKRVYIIRDTISYCFIGSELKRQENSGDFVLMAEHISGSFSASDATLQRNALVKVTFNLDFDDVEVPIEQTLHISNVP